MAHPNVVYAIHNFEAENDDEITFQLGEPILILEKDDQFMDGWWQGRNIHGQIGLFPMNYTSSEKPDHSRISFYRREYSNQVNNIGVYRRTSGSTFSSGITDSTETLLHKKERSNDEMFGVSQKSPLDWSIEEVITWLESVGLENVICNFIDQDISGDVLLNLTHEGLKELGINTYGRRYRVINAIKTLKRVSAEEYDNHNNCLSPRKNDMYTFNPDTLSSVDSIASNSPLFPKQPLGFLSEETHYNFPLKPSFLLSHDNLNTTLTNSTISNSRSTIGSIKKNSSEQGNVIGSFDSTYDGLYGCSNTKSTSPELEGWMYKRSERFKTWNKRWFALRDFNLIYFKNSKEIKPKGVIHLNGYKVIPDTVSPSGRKYSFRLHHERDKDFQFCTEDLNDMKKWTQALMKTTIKRDVHMPVVSSSNQYTVPLDIAQQMKPRPPSMLMYKQNNADKKLYSLPPLVQTEELDETLLWMEHPYTSENQPQSLVIKSYVSSFNGPEKEETGSLCEQAVPQTSGYTDLLSTGQWYDDRLLEWVNLHLEYNIENLSQSFCSGEILLEILESVSGQVINYTTKNPVKSMNMLDNIVVAFKFMSQLGIEENGYTIKDIFSGNKGNIINMLVAIKDWSESLK